MTTTAQSYFEVHTEHYADFDTVIHHLVALRDVFDLLGHGQQRDVLAEPLRGVTDPIALWDELRPLLDDYDGIDGVQAVSDLQDRGQRPTSPGDAIAQRLSEIGKDIHFAVRQHRLAAAEKLAATSCTTGQGALLALTR